MIIILAFNDLAYHNCHNRALINLSAGCLGIESIFQKIIFIKGYRCYPTFIGLEAYVFFPFF